MQHKAIKSLLTKYKEISLLGKISAILDWDLNVNLPRKAAAGRAEQSAYITQAVAQKWQDEEFKSLLQSAIEQKNSFNEIEQAIVRNLEHMAKVYLRVPIDVLVEKSKATSLGFMAWQEAKQMDNFKKFQPHLEKIVELEKAIAEHIGYVDKPYDALLDMYEPGLTTKDCQAIFKTLTRELTATLKRIQKSRNYGKDSLYTDKEFSVNDQRQLSLFILRKMGYDLDAGRMDISSHPFTTTLGSQDIRITNRYKLDDFVESLMVAMHEGGHALYEQGVREDFDSTPLEGGVSLGIHESQSRFWENQIGRSKSFLEFMTPILQAFYPDQLANIDSDILQLHFNKVAPSLIRVEADEVTYNLHIALRFEIEEELINGKLKISQLPEVWRAKMKKYLGVVPETDREGVLQDVHWAYGSFGYFPTYTLGNLYAAQFTNTMKKKLKLDDLIQKGDFKPILDWSIKNIHQYGGLYWPSDLVKRVTGKKLGTSHFLSYIHNKYLGLYK